MCRELNAIGLPDPVFDNNTFILKTTICSAAYEKLPIGQPKVTDSEEKLPIGQPKVTDSGEKLPIGQPKVTDSGEKLLIEHAKVTDSEEDIIIDMVSYTKILRLCTRCEVRVM